MKYIKECFYSWFPKLSPAYKEQKIAEMLDKLNTEACIFIIITAIGVTLWSLYFSKYMEKVMEWVKFKFNVTSQKLKLAFAFLAAVLYMALGVFCLWPGMKPIAIFAILLFMLLSLPFTWKVYASFEADDKFARRYALNCLSKYVFFIALIAVVSLFLLNADSSLCALNILTP